MKKKKERKFSGDLLHALLRGLAVFAVFGMSLYAYAVVYPTNQPNPVSGVVGLYVGKTTSTYSGNIGGYSTANTHCDSEYDGAHICSAMEIINTYNHNPTAVANLSNTVWLNNGPPAFTQDAPNDCNGWTNTTNAYFGTSWNFALKFGTAGSCNLSQSFGCCK